MRRAAQAGTRGWGFALAEILTPWDRRNFRIAAHPEPPRLPEDRRRMIDPSSPSPLSPESGTVRRSFFPRGPPDQLQASSRATRETRGAQAQEGRARGAPPENPSEAERARFRAGRRGERGRSGAAALAGRGRGFEGGHPGSPALNCDGLKIPLERIPSPLAALATKNKTR